uniref:Uncharacterized protein n=1 Tax=Anguilla anguilla TaxID=7936 RepID=A0A0E9QTJ6_ANGAN
MKSLPFKTPSPTQKTNTHTHKRNVGMTNGKYPT